MKDKTKTTIGWLIILAVIILIFLWISGSFNGCFGKIADVISPSSQKEQRIQDSIVYNKKLETSLDCVLLNKKIDSLENEWSGKKKDELIKRIEKLEACCEKNKSEKVITGKKVSSFKKTETKKERKKKLIKKDEIKKPAEENKKVKKVDESSQKNQKKKNVVSSTIIIINESAQKSPPELEKKIVKKEEKKNERCKDPHPLY